MAGKATCNPALVSIPLGCFGTPSWLGWAVVGDGAAQWPSQPPNCCKAVVLLILVPSLSPAPSGCLLPPRAPLHLLVATAHELNPFNVVVVCFWNSSLFSPTIQLQSNVRTRSKPTSHKLSPAVTDSSKTPCV